MSHPDYSLVYWAKNLDDAFDKAAALGFGEDFDWCPTDESVKKFWGPDAKRPVFCGPKVHLATLKVHGFKWWRK